ncbi:MAG: hypothetical protein ACYC4R_09205 [Anaerolineae bacterium]
MVSGILEQRAMGGRTGRIVFWATVSLIGCRAVWCTIATLYAVPGTGTPHTLGETLSYLSRMGGGASYLGWILAVLLVTVLVARDVRWFTLPVPASCRDLKTVLCLARFASLLPALVLLAAAPLLSGALATLVLRAVGAGWVAGQVDIIHLLGGVLRSTWSLLPYVSLSFLLVIDTQSVIAALGGSMLFGTLFEGLMPRLLALVGERLTWATAFLPGRLASSLVESTAAGQQAGPVLGVAPAQAALGIAVWTALCLGLALYILMRREGRIASALVGTRGVTWR